MKQVPKAESLYIKGFLLGKCAHKSMYAQSPVRKMSFSHRLYEYCAISNPYNLQTLLGRHDGNISINSGVFKRFVIRGNIGHADNSEGPYC
jgi:hypothetical protein